MANVYFSATVGTDGSLTIPAFAMRGLGLEPGDEVGLAVPLDLPACGFDCACDELFLSRCCADIVCGGYTTEGDTANIPSRLFARADIPIGGSVYAMAGDGALVLVASSEDGADLSAEIYEFLGELGVRAGQPIPLSADF